jgi:hypothetical protein
VADGPMGRAVASAVRRGLGGIRQQGRDRAAVVLAQAYAAAIDGADPCEHCGRGAGAGDVGKLGPQLLGVLDALALTPRARAAAAAGGGRPAAPVPAAETPLQRLRRQHAERAG